MTLPRLARALLASAAVVAAACGGNGNGGGGGGGGESRQAGSPGEVFSSTCGNCHTLKAAGTQGQVGPDLDDLEPDAARVREAIRQGPSIMPENLLDGRQADEVAKYVAENAGR